MDMNFVTTILNHLEPTLDPKIVSFLREQLVTNPKMFNQNFLEKLREFSNGIPEHCNQPNDCRNCPIKKPCSWCQSFCSGCIYEFDLECDGD